jgi:hypothetical protein
MIGGKLNGLLPVNNLLKFQTQAGTKHHIPVPPNSLVRLIPVALVCVPQKFWGNSKKQEVLTFSADRV